MKKKTKKVFTVTCAFCEKEFQKLLTINPEAEDKETQQQAYCPWCKKLVSFTVKAEVLDDIILRSVKNYRQ